MNQIARAAGLHEALDRVLAESVTRITGSAAAMPRPGQVRLAHDVLEAMIGDSEGVPGHTAGSAPTGVGKSLGLLAPAYVMAALRQERTVLSTHSLALMAQIFHKDSPTVADAVEAVTGKRPSLAVLKGFGNSICTLAVHAAASDYITDKVPAAGHGDVWDLSKLRIASRDEDATQMLRDMRDTITAPVKGRRGRTRASLDALGISPTVRIGDQSFPQQSASDLLAWALDQATQPGARGDRSDYTGQLTDQLWSAISVSPSDCIGVSCPLIALCRPRAARRQAAEADIVVTNHAILGVQAAMQVPILLGSKTLGNFDHLMVDEAHELPGVIRNSGAKEISARRITSLARALDQTLVSTAGDTSVVSLVTVGHGLAERVEEDLNSVIHNAHVDPGTGVKFDPESNPLQHTGDAIQAWCKQALGLCPSVDSQSTPKARLRIKKLRSRLTALDTDLTSALATDPETVRWVEQPARENSAAVTSVLRLSPVDVSGLISSNLFQAVAVEDTDDTDSDEATVDGEKVKYPLAVAMVSATLPMSFRRDSGIRAQVREYESPFDDAYSRSMAHCPKLTTSAELDQVTKPGYNGKVRFDTAKHMRWAADRIVEMVTVNGGSALILSANRAAGLEYTARLRAELDESIVVHSQWDGRDPRHIADEWRADPTSVMVGTRSFMTGVDAPGETCSLVIVDRVPRAAGNVVDDARVELLIKAQQLNKWDAERFVYVADAALLLEQAAGRLVRSVTDSGLFACLDPRLVPGTALSYPKQTSDVYLRALRRFKIRKVLPSEVNTFLTSRTGTTKEVA